MNKMWYEYYSNKYEIRPMVAGFPYRLFITDITQLVGSPYSCAY